MEKMKSIFSMWGERGLIATFFADLNQLAETETTPNFLQIVEFPERPMICSLSPVAIHYIIEPDFANTGFGHPDAVIALEYQDSRAVIIVEAKRTELASACAPRSQRGQKGFNSTLNGQLELDYCLAMALSEYHEGDTELVEPEWVLSSPYKNERKGELRRLKNPAVLNDVVSLIGGLPLDCYYFLVITNDKQNPFLRVSGDDDYLPELFRPDLSGHTFTNDWQEYRRRFGWLNYTKMKEFIEKNRLTMDSLFLQSLSINRGNMKGPSHSGTRLIYAPKINPRTFLHFSWRNESCALRDYSRSDTEEPSPDWSYQTSDVKRMIDKEIRVHNKKNVQDVSFWHKKILEENNVQKLSHSGQGVSLIYAPQINPRTFLHFSWRNESCALRDYSRSDTEEPSPDRKQTSHVERMIDKEISVHNKKNVPEVSFWHKKILEANNAHLKK